MSPANGNGSQAAIESPGVQREAARSIPKETAAGVQSQQQLNYSSNDDSQGTTGTHDSDRVFTPPESDSGASSGAAQGNGNTSSQESQLLQLSQLAAAQTKLAEGGQSRKRTADGAVKQTRDSSSTSPVRKPGHSRNTSTVSAASTTSSRIGELSAELKTKLSYAMIKVNNGWQTHSIDEVESMASQAASPTSSTSTIHGRYGASASPRVHLASMRHGTQSAGISPIRQQPPNGRMYETFWNDNNARTQHHSASPPATQTQVPMLAPPAPIQPGRSGSLHPRRTSNARYAPAYLSHHTSPHSPAQPSPLQTTPRGSTTRTPQVDPILFSPAQNAREQEALETLMFMSSPGNSANMKHAFSSSQTGNGPLHAQSQRTALPTSKLGPGPTQGQPRKQLPTGRHQAHASTGKRVGFDKSTNDMDRDAQMRSPKTTPRRRTVGGPRPPLSMPNALAPPRERPQLKDDDIERMLDRVAAEDSSDSDGEITIPRDPRRDRSNVLRV